MAGCDHFAHSVLADSVASLRAENATLRKRVDESDDYEYQSSRVIDAIRQIADAMAQIERLRNQPAETQQ